MGIFKTFKNLVIMKDIKLAVVGSSKYNNRNRVWFEINEVRKVYNVVQIISGDAPGVDTDAKAYAKEYGIDYRGCSAEWSDMKLPCVERINARGQKYNALAGFKRNTTIVIEADKVLALIKDNSPGTNDTIGKAEAAGKLFRKIVL